MGVFARMCLYGERPITIELGEGATTGGAAVRGAPVAGRSCLGEVVCACCSAEMAATLPARDLHQSLNYRDNSPTKDTQTSQRPRRQWNVHGKHVLS